MKNTIVVYYSRKGSNRYLAHKIAGSLNCELEQLRPRMNSFILFLLGVHLGNKSVKNDLKAFDRVILCGPIWMGRFIPPLRNFVQRYRDSIRQLVFVTCCGSSDELKNEKFGHALVFRQVHALLGDKCRHCEAFPIGLVMPADKRTDGELMMKTVLSDANFSGEIVDRFERMLLWLQEN